VKRDLNCQLLIAVGVLLLSLLACETMEPLMSATTEGLLATLQGHTDTVTCVAFSPDGITLASSSLDTTVRLWDAAMDKRLITLYGHSNAAYAVAFSPDGTLMASVDGDHYAPAAPLRFGEYGTPYIPENEATPTPFMVILWDVATGAELMRWENEMPVYTVVFSPDGTTLAAGSAAGQIDGAVHMWDVASGALKATLQEREGVTVWSIAFSPDGTALASGNEIGITLWDAATGRMRASLGRDPIRSVAFSPDGTLLASGAANGIVRLWNMTTNQEQVTLTKHEGIVYGLAFSVDGTMLASAGQDGTVRLWNVATGDALAALRVPQTWVTSVAFSPDGSLLASGSSDRLIRLWDLGQVLGDERQDNPSQEVP